MKMKLGISMIRVLSVLLAAFILSACSNQGVSLNSPKDSGSQSHGADNMDPSLADPNFAVSGYQVGEIPPVPLFTLPDLSLLDASKDAFIIKFAEIDNKYPGLTISPAKGNGVRRITANGAFLAYGDGSSDYYGADGTIHKYSDGSGDYYRDGVTVHNYGDGSGDYYGNGVTIHNYGDGSGDYYHNNVTIHIYNDGSGDKYGPDGTIHIYKDGSGDYYGANVTIHNYGDGSGDYYGYAADGSPLTIRNDGSGVAKVISNKGTITVKADPLPSVPTLGKFPPLDALKPEEYSGLLITLDAGLLFDFNKYEIRPDARSLISTIAQAMNENSVPVATIEGHTDSIGSEEYNQTLSEKRAQAVLNALRAEGVGTSLNSVGYGKTRPVAANTTSDGMDNPAGRQLNRRVEIFIPTF